jgi:ribonuclease P protein component
VAESSAPRRIALSLRRLHTPYMYKQVFENGRALRGSPVTLRLFRAEQDITRVGFIIRKKTGKAPLRNSIRRTLRTSFQAALPLLGEGAWIVFDVSDKAASVTRARLREEADKLLLAAAAAVAGSGAKPSLPEAGISPAAKRAG